MPLPLLARTAVNVRKPGSALERMLLTSDSPTSEPLTATIVSPTLNLREHGDPLAIFTITLLSERLMPSPLPSSIMKSPSTAEKLVSLVTFS